MKKRIAKHGTISRYTNNDCRCARCRKAQREYMRDLRAKIRQRNEGEIPHGVNGYENYGCRCEVCSAAKAQSRKRKVAV